MYTSGRNTESGRHALAIGVWENEGGAPAPDVLEHQYGRKIETDRSPTVHHVLTGVEAPVGGRTKMVFCRSRVTDSLLSPNTRHARLRKDCGGLLLPAIDATRSTVPAMTLASEFLDLGLQLVILAMVCENRAINDDHPIEWQMH